MVPFSKGSEVVVGGFSDLPKFYIDNQTIDGNVISITAYDLCRQLSQPFRADAIEHETVDSVLGIIKTQCGFTGISGSYQGGDMSKKFYQSTNCNNIVQSIATVSGCIAMCNSYNQLAFMPVNGTYSWTFADEYSKVNVYPVSTYSKLVVTGDSSEVSEFGTGNAENIVELSSPLFSETTMTDLYNNVFADGYDIKPMSVKAKISGNIDPLGEIGCGDYDYKVSSVNITLGKGGAIADLSMNKPSESSTAYNNAMSRAISERIATNRVYGINYINTDGAGVRIKI